MRAPPRARVEGGVVVEAVDATKVKPNLTSSFTCCHLSLSWMEFFFTKWMRIRNP